MLAMALQSALSSAFLLEQGAWVCLGTLPGLLHCYFRAQEPSIEKAGDIVILTRALNV